MAQPSNTLSTDAYADQILGYINFSDGNHDSATFQALDGLFAAELETDAGCESTVSCPTTDVEGQPTEQELPSKALESNADADSTEHPFVALRVHQLLRQRLEQLRTTSDVFRDSTQADTTLSIVFEDLLPRYQQQHSDLIFGNSSDFVFNSFFIARAMETVLREFNVSNTDTRTTQTIADAAFEKFNDYLGHRPVATLETRRVEPYAQEWIRPIPIYIRGTGLATSCYRDIVERALQFLSQTDESILRAAHFDPERLDELAIDPRSFDFDHPANKRPNYHFGQWDEHSVDKEGYFHRFIIHDVTLAGLMDRVNRASGDADQSIDRDEALSEAGAVLAGTMLMAAGVSGRGPGAFDSETTLSTLLPVIAKYRDQFYTDLLKTLPDQHRQRLQVELKIRQQPFGAARQDLNACLSHRRAYQLVNCRLASIYARMGYPEAATKQLDNVAVASVRIVCQIDCLLGSIYLSLREGDLQTAVEKVPEAIALLKRGIHCGAIVDPWNILGFDANYSLFPALENTVRDHRVFELVDLMERIFAVCSELLSEAAARNEEQLYRSIRLDFQQLVDWWRQFAAHEVSSVDAVDAQEIFAAAQLVAEALNLWHEGGAESGDISFWSKHAQLFDSPKAYSLVVSALMQRGDYQTTSVLLVHWVSQAEQVPLQLGDSSFHQLVDQWINVQKESLLSAFAPQKDQLPASNKGPIDIDAESAEAPETIWNRIRKFYDYIEANADHYWNAPEFQLLTATGSKGSPQPPVDDGALDLTNDTGDDEDDDRSLYDAAYDDVIYSDSTDDGFDGDVFGQNDDESDAALEAEVERVLDWLEFQETVASFWRVSSTVPLPVTRVEDLTPVIEKSLRSRREIVLSWLDQAVKHRDQLTHLIESINRYAIPTTGASHEAMMRYDLHRAHKEALLEQTIHASIETQNAIRLLGSVIRAIGHLLDQQPLNEQTDATEGTLSAEKNEEYESDNSQLISVFAAVLLEDPKLVQEHIDDFLQCLHRYPLLYVPLSRNGDPGHIVCARTLQTHLLDLLERMPALGLLTETCELLRTALAMERNNPIGQGAVTSFDELFKVGYTSMVHSLVRSSEQLRDDLLDADPEDLNNALVQAETQLFDCVQLLTESTLGYWLSHGETLRLSVLEKVFDSRENGPWEKLVGFVQEYGTGLFTQQFLHAGNIRGILHHGVENWLKEVSVNPPAEIQTRLFEDIGSRISLKDATRQLSLILEAVIENYNEYRDYNTTTTQSDHGGSLYMLLDFLRLRSRYDRVSWKLKPVAWAHRILVREQKNNVARMWRKSLLEKVGEEADKFEASYKTLRKQYSMQMASVGRRIEGRFVHQLQIDRLRAQVIPAMIDPTQRSSKRAFEKLSQEAQAFLRSTTGVGVDLPAWLAALENEVEQFYTPDRFRSIGSSRSSTTNTRPTEIADLREQLEILLENTRANRAD